MYSFPNLKPVCSFMSSSNKLDTKLWKILKEMEISDYLTCLLRNLYAGQEETVRTVQGCILSPKLRKTHVSHCSLLPLLMGCLGQVIWEIGVCRMQVECHGHCGKAWLELGHLPLCGPAAWARVGGRPHFQVTPVLFQSCYVPRHVAATSAQQGSQGEAEEAAGSISGKEYIKAVHRHPAYLTSMLSTSLKCWAG